MLIGAEETRYCHDGELIGWHRLSHVIYLLLFLGIHLKIYIMCDSIMFMHENLVLGVVSMFDTGLVSITFRSKSSEEVMRSASECGLKYIEWGSDVHAPQNDPQKLRGIAAAQKEYGISCCSYGTYFYLGVTPIDQLPDYIRAAKLLGTRVLRLWAGKKSGHKWTPEEKEDLFRQCAQAAAMAEDADVVLCLECHRNTFTEAGESALELMRSVNSKAFRMYWQPNPDASVEDNIRYARMIAEYTVHIHVFNITGYTGFPLEEGIGDWLLYLREFRGDHLLLLESMPDNLSDRLAREADSLRKIIEMQRN